MGLFDIFKSKSSNSDGGDKKKSNPAAKWAEAAGSKRAQGYDRQEAIQELCALKSPEAVEALLKRFTFVTDPSITDQEEKDMAFAGIIATGRDAVAPVRAFAAKAESLSWPLRILKELLSEEEFVDELIGLLGKWDTEYAKFIDPKLTLLDTLEDFKNPKIRPAVEPFLQDFTEQARFNAMKAIFAQKEPEAIGPFIAQMLEEESVRIKSKIADGFIALGWEVPEEHRDGVRKILPYEYGIDGEGRFTHR